MKKIESKKLVNCDKIQLIRDKLFELTDSIKSLDKQLFIILSKLYESVDSDKEIYFNNLQLIVSMIIFYNKQKSILQESLVKYYAIISNNDENRASDYIKLWEIDLNEEWKGVNQFEFKPISYTDWKEIISLYKEKMNDEEFLLLQTLCGIEKCEEKVYINKKKKIS